MRLFPNQAMAIPCLLFLILSIPSVSTETIYPATLAVVGPPQSGKSTILGRLRADRDTLDLRPTEYPAPPSSGKGNMYQWLLDSAEEREAGRTLGLHFVRYWGFAVDYQVIDTPGWGGLPSHNGEDRDAESIKALRAADKALLVVSAVDSDNSLENQERLKDCIETLVGLGLGTGNVLVVITKMDHPTVDYSQQKFEAIRATVQSLFDSAEEGIPKKTPSVSLAFVPISGLEGINMLPMAPKRMPWWTDQYLGVKIAQLGIPLSDPWTNREMAFRTTIIQRDQDDAQNPSRITVQGKVEQGKTAPGDEIILCPSNTMVRVNKVLVYNSTRPIAEPFTFVSIEVEPYNPVSIDQDIHFVIDTDYEDGCEGGIYTSIHVLLRPVSTPATHASSYCTDPLFSHRSSDYTIVSSLGSGRITFGDDCPSAEEGGVTLVPSERCVAVHLEDVGIGAVVGRNRGGRVLIRRDSRTIAKGFMVKID